MAKSTVLDAGPLLTGELKIKLKRNTADGRLSFEAGGKREKGNNGNLEREESGKRKGNENTWV